jgi:hypothetical protein
VTHDDFNVLMAFLSEFKEWWVQYRNVVGYGVIATASLIGFSNGYRR